MKHRHRGSEKTIINGMISHVPEEEEDETPIYQKEYFLRRNDDDEMLVFLCVLEGADEKFLKLGYTEKFETIEAFQFPYGGEIIFYAENVSFLRVIELEIFDPLFQDDSILSRYSYTPKIKLRRGISRCYKIESKKHFRRLFKKLNGWEVKGDIVLNLSDKELFFQDRGYGEFHIESPEERIESRRYGDMPLYEHDPTPSAEEYIRDYERGAIFKYDPPDGGF